MWTWNSSKLRTKKLVKASIPFLYINSPTLKIIVPKKHFPSSAYTTIGLHRVISTLHNRVIILYSAEWSPKQLLSFCTGRVVVISKKPQTLVSYFLPWYAKQPLFNACLSALWIQVLVLYLNMMGCRCFQIDLYNIGRVEDEKLR